MCKIELRRYRILSLYAQGFGYAFIAKRFGISRQRVYQIIGFDSEWKRIRARVLERDKRQCQWNGCKIDKKNYLIVHHIDENPANNVEGNLIALCVTCHKRFHAIDGMKFVQPKQDKSSSKRRRLIVLEDKILAYRLAKH